MLGMIHPLFAQGASGGGGGGGSDPNWASVILLVGAEESATQAVDASKYRRGLVKTASAAVSTAQAKFGTASLNFPSSGKFSAADVSEFDFGSGPWTVELFVYFTASGGHVIGQRNVTFNMSGSSWVITMVGSSQFEFTYVDSGGSATQLTTPSSYATNTWHHLCWEKDGSGKLRAYVNGVMTNSSTPAGGTIWNSTVQLSMGQTSGGGLQFAGYVDELRITKGVARYASDGGFTVPAAAYPRDTATYSTATIVQSATLRNDGTIALGSAPTVGNLMVLMTAGWGTSLGSYVPSGFTAVDTFASDANNGVRCWYRWVQSGDTGSYAISASDNQAAVLYEFSGAGGVYSLAGGAMSSFFSGASFSIALDPHAYGSSDVMLVAFEQDTTATWTITGETGVTSDFVTTGASNHTSAFIHINPVTFDGTLAGSTSSAPTQPVYGQFVVVGAPI